MSASKMEVDDDDVWGGGGDDLDEAALIEASQMAEKYQREGEVKYLRGEMRKLEDLLEKERRERRRDMDMMREHINSSEARRKAEVEAIKAEKDFLTQDLRQLKDEVKVKASSNLGKVRKFDLQEPTTDQRLMPPPQFVPGASQKATVPSGIDCSFFEDDEDDVAITTSVHSTRVNGATRTSTSSSVADTAILSTPKVTAESGVQTYSKTRRRDTSRLKKKLEQIDTVRYDILLNTINPSSPGAEQKPEYRLFSFGETREDLNNAEVNLSNFAGEGEELVKAALKDTNDSSKWERLWKWMKGCQELMENRNERLRGSDQFTEAAVKLLVVTPPIMETCPDYIFESCLGYLKSLSTTQILEDKSRHWFDYFDFLLLALNKRENCLVDILQCLAISAASQGFDRRQCHDIGTGKCFMSFISTRCDNLLRGKASKSSKAEDHPPSLSEVIRVSSALSLFLTSRISCHRKPLLSVTPEGCRCGHDLLKVMVSSASAVTKACLSGTHDSDEKLIADAKVASRDCVVCLHHIWSLDPTEFVRALSESPVAQRKYIWLTRQLDREQVRTAIGMRVEEVSILNDLMAEYDDATVDRTNEMEEG